MARPLRFRYSPEPWTDDRVRRELFSPLDGNLGARSVDPRFGPTAGWTPYRFEMNNGDVALFARQDDEAYWMGNTETPPALWRTEKVSWTEAPYPVARWAQRELLADLFDAESFFSAYPHIAWFFLPVFASKDGRETTRTFFRDHAAGFPDTDRASALSYYESVLHTGALDPHRETMAGKLGTSETLDLTRMRAAMSEFTVAGLLVDAGYEVIPEAEVSTGHSLDFRVRGEGCETLVEVTRPSPPGSRAASDAITAVQETAATKTDAGGQLRDHGGGATLFVDCSSFPDDAWATVRELRPVVGHRPAVVFRVRPGDGDKRTCEGYRLGGTVLSLPTVTWLEE